MNHTGPFSEADFMLRPDGRCYHLNVNAQEVAPLVIFVGDPNRVALLSQCFDQIETKRQNREYVVHTGYLGRKRLSVISTGIGVGNVDIVLNELDSVFNIDSQTRQTKAELTKLTLIRFGTCGGLQTDLPLGSLISSTAGLAFDGLLNFYQHQYQPHQQRLLQALKQHFTKLPSLSNLYLGHSAHHLQRLFAHFPSGLTLTCMGFYGPQYRQLRIPLPSIDLLTQAQTFQFEDQNIINFEMETAPLLAISQLLGHHALSLSVLVAQRAHKTIHPNPKQAVISGIEQLFTILSEQTIIANPT